MPTPQGDDGSADLSYIEAAARRSRPGAAAGVRRHQQVHRAGRLHPRRRAGARAATTSPSCRTPSSSARARRCTTASTPTASSSAPRTKRPPSGSPSLFERDQGAGHRHRPGFGRDDQVRLQRLPGHEDQLRQRHRQRVRGRRRRRPRRRRSAWATTSASASSSSSRAPAGAAVASPRTRARWCASPRTTATTSPSSGASSRSTTSSSTAWRPRSSGMAGGSVDGQDGRRVGPHVQGPHRRPSGARPALEVIERLQAKGAEDPRPTTRRRRRRLTGVERCADPYAACEGADVLAVLTEWDELRWLDFEKVAGLMHGPGWSTAATSSTLPPSGARASSTRVSGARDRSTRRRHRRRRLPRLPPLSRPARSRRRGDRHRQPHHGVDAQRRGSGRHRRLHVPAPRRVELRPRRRAGRRRDAPRLPGVTGRLRAHPDPDPQGRVAGHAARARAWPRTRAPVSSSPRRARSTAIPWSTRSPRPTGAT